MSAGASRRRVSSGSPYEASVGFSRAVRVGSVVHVAGTAPIWPDGSCPDDARAQADRCFDIAIDALEEAGATVQDVVRTRMFLTDAAHEQAVSSAHGARFADVRPAATMVVVKALLDPRWHVEIEVEAIVEG